MLLAFSVSGPVGELRRSVRDARSKTNVNPDVRFVVVKIAIMMAYLQRSLYGPMREPFNEKHPSVVFAVERLMRMEPMESIPSDPVTMAHVARFELIRMRTFWLNMSGLMVVYDGRAPYSDILEDGDMVAMDQFLFDEPGEHSKGFLDETRWKKYGQPISSIAKEYPNTLLGEICAMIVAGRQYHMREAERRNVSA